MKIMVKVRDVYGVRNIYPACEKAVLFAQIAGTKTLTPYAVKYIKALGVEIEVEQEEVSL